MRCKPGDLAIIRCGTETPDALRYNGTLVEVIHLQPNVGFNLPDGYPHAPASGPDRWVIKNLTGIFMAPVEGRPSRRRTQYATCGDKSLVPLPGIGDEASIEEMAAVSEGSTNA